MKIWSLVAFFALLATFSPAQRDSTPQASRPAIVVKVFCDRWGTEIPRKLPAPRVAKTAGAFDLQGHRLHQEIGPLRLLTLEKLTRHLRKLGARQIGARSPIVVQAGPAVCCVDIARTVEAIRAAGFEGIGFSTFHAARKKPRLELRKVVLRFPRHLPEGWHPTITISQRGRIARAGKTVHDPQQHEVELESLARLARELTDEARRQVPFGLREVAGKKRESVETPVVVRVDPFTEWLHVAKVAHALDGLDVPFWHIDLELRGESSGKAAEKH